MAHTTLGQDRATAQILMFSNKLFAVSRRARSNEFFLASPAKSSEGGHVESKNRSGREQRPFFLSRNFLLLWKQATTPITESLKGGRSIHQMQGHKVDAYPKYSPISQTGYIGRTETELSSCSNRSSPLA